MHFCIHELVSFDFDKEDHMKQHKAIAIVLAAGSGKRMGTTSAKQYLDLAGKPILWYSLSAMNSSPLIDEIILVVGKGDVAQCRREYVDAYSFMKVRTVIEGGAERYLSVACALQTITEEEAVLFIQDSARPFLTQTLLEDLNQAVYQYHAATAAVPAKDTIKIADADGLSEQTPNRDTLWIVQTPQVFFLSLLRQAYHKLLAELPKLTKKGVQITDDTTVVELMLHHPSKMVMGSYQNIKITTPEDLVYAQAYLASVT
jgi:2-C-methyl-D-erythritol 4-phosphate cytidylyltransferase